MNKRILTLCLALALCLSLIPVTSFAAAPLYTYQEVKTGVKATSISMMANGMGSFKIINDDYELVSKGVIDPSGKVILTRVPQSGDPEEGTIDVSTGYVAAGNVIVDLQSFVTGEADTWSGLAYDVNLYTSSGALITSAAQIIANYDKVDKSEVIPSGTRVYFGNDGYLTVFAYRNGYELYAYVIDPQTQKVVMKQLIDEGSPTAEGESWFITSVNEGLIAGNHAEYGYDADGYYYYNYLNAGWLDLNGNYKVSVDTDKYGDWWNFGCDRAIVWSKASDLYGYVDKTGKEVIPCKFRDASTFKDGYAYVKDADGRVGYIDVNGNTVIPFNYEYAYGYGEGLFTVGHAGQYDEYYGLVDINNTEVVPTVGFTDMSIVKNGIAYGIKDGEIIILKFTKDEASAKDVSNIFKDVPSDAWYKKFLQKAYDNGIVGGMTADTYGPAKNLTHAQIMVMVANLHSMQKGDNFKASSVPGDHWAASFRDYCKAEGIIDARFDEALDANVTRAEMAYYFANALTASSYKNKKDASFSDMPENGYDEYIMKLAKADIVGGYNDGTFKPGNLVTRAEASVFISNIIDAMN
jgi:hypothetical protein